MGVDPFNQLLLEALSGARFATLYALGAAVLASFGVLAFFRRRVQRSMSPKTPSAAKPEPIPESTLSTPERAPRAPVPWHTLSQAAVGHRAGLARMYLLAGAGLAVGLAVIDAIVNTRQQRFSVLAFLYAAVCFSTPLALSVRLLYGRWKPALAIVGCQLVALLALGPFVPEMADEAPAAAVAMSMLLTLMLHPRIRAMGVLAAGFFTVVFSGVLISVVLSIFLMRDSIRTNVLSDPRVAPVKQFVGAHDTSNAGTLAWINLMSDSSFWRDQGLFLLRTTAVLALVGITASVVLGSLVFLLVTRSYARKRLSDQSLVIASVWLFPAIATASVLTPWGLWANLACVAIVGFVMVAGWRRREARDETPGVKLLLLRSFTLGERSNRLFQDLESLWRSIGSIQLVGAVDLALTTLEPHELLDFFRGRSGREFVHAPADVDARLASFDHARDPDGRFRVNVIFCGNDEIWKYAVSRMLIDADCVLMDLRGFTRHRAGCVFEIRILAASELPIRTVFLVDGTTDRGFISETWAAAAKAPSGGVHGNPFEFVSEEPSDGSVSERVINGFLSQRVVR